MGFFLGLLGGDIGGERDGDIGGGRNGERDPWIISLFLPDGRVEHFRVLW